ncbi:MAG: RNA polymerase sigma factor [Ignavibacteria bacterium]
MPDSYSEVINKIRKGDSSEFKIIAEELKDKAFSLTIKILKSKEEAEDSLQEAFLKLYRAIMENQYEQRSRLSTYFYSIVYNTAIDNYKKIKSKRFNIISIDVDDSNFEEGDDLLKKYYESEIQQNIYEERHEMGSEKKISGKEVEKIIHNFIGLIPEQYSVILTMFYINDLSHEEISEILKLPLGTVKNRIFRAKAKLKDIILKKYPEEEILQYV